MNSSMPGFGRSRLLLSALVALVVACGGGAAAPTPSAAVSLTPESQLTVAGAAGPPGDVFHNALNTWGAANNVKITWITGTTSQLFSQLQAQSQAGNVQLDIVGGNDQTTSVGRAQGLYAPINLNVFTVKKDLDPDLAFTKDVVGNPPIAAFYSFNPNGIIYNADVFQKNGWPVPTSWLDLLNPTYSKCWLPLDPNQGVPWIPMINYILTGDWNNSTQTFPKLKAVAPNVQAWTNTIPTAVTAVAKGTACMTEGNQGRYLNAAATAPQLRYVTPKEGGIVIGGTYGVTKKAPHPNAAQLALNLLLGQQPGQDFLSQACFPSTNLKVVAATTGPCVGVPTVAEAKKLGLKRPPISTYDHLDDWLHQYQSIASGS
jgi:putative spermidine/putrescine transport system substrate-binding protein